MIKKFHATTTRDALRQVRDALGANAIILSNRQVDGGVEIIAVADLDVAALAEQAQSVNPAPHGISPSEYSREAASAYRAVQREIPPPPEAPLASKPRAQPMERAAAFSERAGAPARSHVGFPEQEAGLILRHDDSPAERASSLFSSRRAGAAGDRPAAPPIRGGGRGTSPFADQGGRTHEKDPPNLTSFTEYLAQRDATIIRPTPGRKRPETPPPARPQAAPAATRPAEPELPPVVHELAREVRMLRALLEGQLAGLAWGDTARREPMRAEIMKRLLAAGFSPALTRQLLEKMPADQGMERAMKWVRAALAHNLKVADGVDDLLDRGGIYALVGPTGVGKTTTVAKLAARAVLKHGANRVAMVTTDSYRIGAQDQLRIYGRILGTPVFAARDENDLELTLLDLSGKHLVLIDTIGMNQRDRRVAEQIAMLSEEKQEVKRLLLLSAPAQGITLEEVVRAYSGPGLAGCILTKIDEALSYGPVLDVAIRHQLHVRYVTNGQRVPEDLHLANALYLVDRAFRLGTPDPVFAAGDDDYPVLVAAAEAAPRTAAPDEDYVAEGMLGAAG